MSQSTLFFVDRKALGNDRSHDISEEAIDPDADSQSETQVPMFHLKPKESGNVKQINQEKKTCTQEQSYTTKEGDDCEGIDFTPLDSPMQTSDAMNKISLSDQKLDSKVLQRENTEENVELEVVSKPKTQSKAKNRTAGRKSLSTTSYNGSLIGILKKANKFLRIKRRHKDINSDGNHKPDENTENILTEFAVADEDISKSSETFHFSSDESKETSENSECGLSSMVRDCKIPSNSVSALTDHLRDINKASSQKRRHQSGNTMLEMQKDLTVKKLKKANSASDKIEKCGDHEVEPSGFSHDLNILCIDKMELKKSPNSNNTNKFKDAFIGEQASPKGHLSAGKPLEKQSEKQVITDKGVSNNINAEINHNENRNHSTESLNKSPDPALSEHLCETKQEGAKNSSLVSGIPKSIEVNAEKTSPSRSFHRKLNFISSNKRKAAKRIEDSSWRVEEGICIKNSDESKSGSDMSSRGGNDKLETDGSSSDNSGKVDRYVKKHTRLSDDNFDTHVPRKCRREPKLRKNRQTFKMEDFIDDECVEDNRLESDMSVNSQDNYLSDEDFLTLKESRTRSSNSNLDANLYSSGARTTSKKKLKSVQRHSFIDDECSEDNRMESDMSSNSHSSSVNSESSFNNSETNNVDVTKNPISDGESGLNLQVKTRKEQSRVDIDGTCSKDSDVESQDSFINDEILSDDYSENSNIGSEPDATSCSYEVESVPDWGHKRNRKGEQQKNKKKKMAKIESSSDDTPVKTKLVRHLVSSVSPSKVRNDESSPKKNDTQIEKNRLPLSSEIVDDPGRSVEKDKTKEGDSICSPGSTLNNDISSINKHNNGINSEKSLKHSSKNVRYEEVKDSDDVCDFVFQTPIVLIERSAEPVEDLNLKSKDHQIQRQYPDEKCEEPCSPENRTLKVYTPVVCIKNIDKVDSVDDVVVNAREKTPDGVTRLTSE